MVSAVLNVLCGTLEEIKLMVLSYHQWKPLMIV
jgi:hypothetical protein